MAKGRKDQDQRTKESIGTHLSSFRLFALSPFRPFAFSPFRLFVISAAIALALAMALPVGLRQHVGDDFHVFWQAGRNFATGAPLYHGDLPGARPFKYPPFAAMVFTPLAWFPLPVAGVLVSLLNLALWVVAVILTRDIVARMTGAAGRWTLAVAVLLSGRFFMDNFHHVQMNEVIFVLVLLGLRAYLAGKDVAAAAALVAATGIKITPVFFVAWLVLRGRRRAAVAVLPLAAAVVLVPLLLRGPSRGAAELVEYYHGFLEKHQHGEIGSYQGGQNVAALVSRMTRPAEDKAVSYHWLPMEEATAQRLYQGLWAIILVVFLGTLILLRVRRAPLTAMELAMVFLASLLLSPITFTTHLVPLLFVLTAVLSSRPVLDTLPRRILATVAGAAVTLCGLSGRDLVGERLYHAAWGYSVCAWALLALFALTVISVATSSSPRATRPRA